MADNYVKDHDEYTPSDGIPADSCGAEAKKPGRVVRDLLEAAVIAVFLAVIIKVFLFQNFIIPSGSMRPTLMEGDTIYINKLTYRFSDPQRGDIIVFKYPLDPSKDYVKRIIGLPGESIAIKDSIVYINGREIDQPYLPPGLEYPDFPPYKIPKDSYFVMGDNRPGSSDSRVWGTVPRENILGKAMFIYWPPQRIRMLH